MIDRRMMPGFSGHDHTRGHQVSVIELDGVFAVVSVDTRRGSLWTCPLGGGGGGCVECPLELDAAGPEAEWYYEEGIWDEDEDEIDEDERPWYQADLYEIAFCLTAANLDGRPVVVTGGGRGDLSFPEGSDREGGAVRVWDVRTGRKVGKTLTGHVLGVDSLTTLSCDQGLLAVSSCEEGTLLAWNLTRGGEPVAAITGGYTGGYDGSMGAGLVNGRPVAVTGEYGPFLQAWDLLSGEQIGGALPGIERRANAIALTEVAGRAVVVAGGEGRVLHRWDLASQEPIGSPIARHPDRIMDLEVATVAGRAVAVTGSSDDTVRVWDLERGTQIGAPLTDHRLQTVTEMAGFPVAVTTSSDGTVRVWNLTAATGE
ncbi:WD40 repeat domain-containing protein [Streptomyces sp. HNM1019]|uniref:WD40 repeat domain-containing protein n=1 Tax=Streptomyces sp. HNM1019 TaxID=3424717 RepID=UPI003D787C76